MTTSSESAGWRTVAYITFGALVFAAAVIVTREIQHKKDIEAARRHVKTRDVSELKGWHILTN